jgi:RNase P/RNase MRP subunit p30
MKTPRYSDRRRRYRTAAESSQPGYLAKRLKAYALIAAAPELLEAIEAIHFDISSRGVVNAETQQKMREAIKKAKGL